MSSTPRVDAYIKAHNEKEEWARKLSPIELAEQLERENAALRADKERLDWLESCANYHMDFDLLRWSFFTPSSTDDIRAAIDTARKEQP